jgi:hypothetical protein
MIGGIALSILTFISIIFVFLGLTQILSLSGFYDESDEEKSNAEAEYTLKRESANEIDYYDYYAYNERGNNVVEDVTDSPPLQKERNDSKKRPHYKGKGLYKDDFKSANELLKATESYGMYLTPYPKNTTNRNRAAHYSIENKNRENRPYYKGKGLYKDDFKSPFSTVTAEKSTKEIDGLAELQKVANAIQSRNLSAQ